jgi:hypothetical protein
MADRLASFSDFAAFKLTNIFRPILDRREKILLHGSRCGTIISLSCRDGIADLHQRDDGYGWCRLRWFRIGSLAQTVFSVRTTEKIRHPASFNRAEGERWCRAQESATRRWINGPRIVLRSNGMIDDRKDLESANQKSLAPRNGACGAVLHLPTAI